MPDPLIDYTAEHTEPLMLNRDHVEGFSCTADGGEEGSPIRIWILMNSGERYQLGKAADAEEAQSVTAALRAKTWPA